VLKGIDPLLAPELLKILAEMGHGDEIVLADANFTAASLGRGKPVVRRPGVGMGAACAAVLSVLPLDQAAERPAADMQVGASPEGHRSALQRAPIGRLVEGGHAEAGQFEAMGRFAFYDRARDAFAIVQTGEPQAWANFRFKKGVIADPLRP
jgi:L-fucose mutarotase